MFLKLIACEIAVRELCYVAAQSPHLTDLEFVTQGHHDTPAIGRADLQKRIEATPAGKFDAIILGYGLCSNILVGLAPTHTPLVIPRAHDCITFFLGSRERYQEYFDANPGTYYYTSGWLECARRRGLGPADARNLFSPAQSQVTLNASYALWVEKYGEEKANYLLEVMGEWKANYSRGTLIDYDFTKPLNLAGQVRQLCTERGWEFTQAAGDLGLLQRLVGGDWRENEVLVVKPGERVVAVFDGSIIGKEPLPG